MNIAYLVLSALIMHFTDPALHQILNALKQDDKTQLSSNPALVNCYSLTFFFDENCQHALVLRNTAIHSGTCDSTGLLRWQVLIDLDGDGEDDWEFSTFLPLNNDIENAENGELDKIRDDNGNDVPDIYLAPTMSGEEARATVPELIMGPNTKISINWNVFDECFQQSTCSQIILVTDNKKPIPYGLSLSTRILEDPDGLGGNFRNLVEVIASEFNIASFDNCTLSENLLFTFDNWKPQISDTIINGSEINVNVPHYFDKYGASARYPTTNPEVLKKYNEGELQLWIPAIKSSLKVFNDKYFTSVNYSVAIDVKISVWDQNQNTDFFWVKLTLNCIGCGGCSVQGRIGGSIITESGAGVSNVKVNVHRNQIEYPKSTVSKNGLYAFTEIAYSQSSSDRLSISAEKNDQYNNGISTLDLVLLYRHILGIQSLAFPFKLIAADLNNDQKINSIDLTEMRKIILGVKENFTNASWRFPVEGQVFDTMYVFNYQEEATLVVSENVDDLNFTAVKIGDLNESAEIDGLHAINTETRGDSNLIFSVKDQCISEGDVFEIKVTSSNFVRVFGFQFTMRFNDAEFINAYPDGILVRDTNIGIIQPDLISCSYISAEGKTMPAHRFLFTLVCRAKKSGFLRDFFSITDEITKAESYIGSDMNIQGLRFNFIEKIPITEYKLFQNTPNPFKVTTQIVFDMPRADKAILRIFDSTGRVISVREINAVQGKNIVVFNAEQLPSSGVLFYQLESGGFTDTKKMIFFE